MPNAILTTIAISASSLLFVTAVSSETLPSVVNSTDVISSTDVNLFVSPNIPDALELAGEVVPIHGFGVRESLDKELIVNTYRHSSTILYLKKSSRWFPVIEEILNEEGVPNDFKYLAVIESGLSQVVSPAGASGFWQFMKKTAPEYGLEVSASVDERYDVEKSTRAACQYLKKSHTRFGNWSLAAAAYNMGKYGVEKRLDEQSVDNYWDLHLNSETGRYVYRMLAIKEVMSSPVKYGFHISPENMYLPHEVREFEVSENISNLNDFALENGSNLKELKALNPWLRKGYLTVKPGKTYVISLPKIVTE